jgi:hypothetical protein
MTLRNAREPTDLQWAILDALIPEPPRRKDGRGRPWRSRRSVLSDMFPTTNGNAFLTYVFSKRYVGRGGGDRTRTPFEFAVIYGGQGAIWMMASCC